MKRRDTDRETTQAAKRTGLRFTFGAIAAVLALNLLACGSDSRHVVIHAVTASNEPVQLDSADTDIVFAATWSTASDHLKQALNLDDMKGYVSRRRIVFVFPPDDFEQGEQQNSGSSSAHNSIPPLYDPAFVDDLNAEWAIAKPPQPVQALPAVLVGNRYLSAEQWFASQHVNDSTLDEILPYRGRPSCPPVMAKKVKGTPFPVDPAATDIVIGATWCPHTAELKRALADAKMKPYIAERNIFFLFQPDDLETAAAQFEELVKSGHYPSWQAMQIRDMLRDRRRLSPLFDLAFVEDLGGRWGIATTRKNVNEFPTILAGEKYIDASDWLLDELHVPRSLALEIMNEVKDASSGDSGR